MQSVTNQTAASLSAGLYVVGTPIGNLGDITLRALEVLRQADIICAEDTRVSKRLLQAYGITTHTVSVYAHNEAEMAKKIVSWIASGKVVAQVTDAGTPSICDPGSRLVHAVRQAKQQVYAIPGACALISALSVSGWQADQFYFAGFLPANQRQRDNCLHQIADQNQLVIAYETPHRISKTLAAIEHTMPNRSLLLLRELTKCFESAICGTAYELKQYLIMNPVQHKGEMVLLFAASSTSAKNELTLPVELKKVAKELATFLPLKKVVSLLAELMVFNKKTLYQYLLTKQNSSVLNQDHSSN
jgi:hypothetical protein